ncbi:MAG: type III secretion system regulator SuhB, partial [Pseudomonas sp.]
MQPMLNIALRAARSASELIFRSIERLDTIKVDEKDAKDYVSEVDRAAEQKIIDALRKAYPTHGILGEETGLHKGSGEGEDYLWIIDPLDGTTNFLRGIPHFAVSIACKYRGRLEHAVVLDPVRQEEFTASRGRGAQLNGRRLRVSGRTSLDGALLGTGFPFRDDQMDNLENYLGMFRALVGQTAGIRRAGAASLDLAYVAAGRFDAFWESGLS